MLSECLGMENLLRCFRPCLSFFAGASLFGLTGVLFRDEITSERWLRGQRATNLVLTAGPQPSDSRMADPERPGDIG
jgi:hypothetical protein